LNREQLLEKLIEVDRLGADLGEADHILCMSRVLQDACTAAGIPGAKTSVLGNRVWTQVFRPRRQTNDDPRVVRVLFCGRLEAQKNVHGIVGALARIRSQGWAVHLDICGGRRMNAYLEECLSRLDRGEWRYHGSVPNHRLVRVYQLIDMYVGPSLFEGFQIPLIEALASGKPCVVSNQPPATEIVSEETGALVDPSDPDSIAEGILAVKERLNDPQLRLELRERCRAVALRQWDYVAISRREVQVYLDVLGRGRSSREAVGPARRPPAEAANEEGRSAQGAIEAGRNAALRWVDAQVLPSAGMRVHAGDIRAYPEVSGYFVPTLLHNWARRYLALQLAQWLVRIQNADGSWPDPSGRAAYTFDTGQVIRGLVAVVDTVPGAEAGIRRGCDWLLTQIEPSGRVTTPERSAWRLPNGRVVSDRIHLYTLGPLRDAGKLLDEPRYLEAAERALAYYLSQPDLTAFDTLSHFHAYVLEALIDLGHPQGAAQGMAEVEALQNEDGVVPGYRDVKWLCSPGLAQYAVIWYKLGKPEYANRALDCLCRLQDERGGLFGSYGQGADYFPDKEISWAVKYFLDACHLKTQTYSASPSARNEIWR
jgi:malonyl-CoA O-methyltransferase